MTAFEEDVLYESMLEVQAQELLQNPEVGGALNAEGVLELCKAAGMSEDEAQKAASQRALERLRRELPP